MDPQSGVFDFFAYYRPNAVYAFGRLAHGDLPLWNPSQGVGLPFLATLQTGVLYPPNLLHLLLPAQLAFAVLVALHLGIAAGFAACLARRLGAGGAGALAAGLLFGGCSWLSAALWWPCTLYSAAWLPGVLVAIDRVVERATRSRVGILALVVGLQLLSAWPYVALMTAFTGALYAGTALLEAGLRERRPPLGRGLCLALGALAGACLAAPQLLPAVELVDRSARAPGLLREAQAVLVPFQHDPRRFLAILLAQGANDAVPGVLALPLALLAAFRPGRSRPRLLALLAIGAFALAISFPFHLPVYRWLRRLPLMGDFRFPFRWRLVTTLALAVGAGAGLTRLEEHLALGPRAAPAAGVVLAFGLALAQVLPSAGARLRFPRHAEASVPPPLERLFATLRAATSTDGTRVHWQHRDEIVFADKLGESAGLRVTHDLEPLTPAATARMLTFFETGRAVTIDPRDVGRAPGAGSEHYVGAIPFFGRVGLPQDARRAALLDLLSVRFVLANEPPAWLAERYRALSEPGTTPALFENPLHLPRAFRATRVEPEPGEPQAALERLLAPDFDLRTAALVERPPQILSGPATPDLIAETRLEQDTPERQVILTRGAERALVVVTDLYYPGWEARLDGAPVPILRADTLFRGIAVPPGEHRIELRYRPGSFRRGCALAGAAALGIAAAVLAPGRRRASTVTTS